VKKLRGTYLEPLLTKHAGTDGRVHTTYHLGRGYGDHGGGGTVTGRLSSSEPNLQNIPRDIVVKGTFVPSLGMRMFSADYSQVELRVAAWYAGEETMLEAFRQGLDVHTATLAELEGVKYEYAHKKVKSGEWEENRALVKRVNFGVLYGVGEYRLVQLMRDMGIQISQKRATEIIDWWYANKKSMAKWIDDVQEIAVNEKRVVTPTGRVRRLPYAGWGKGIEAQARRQAVNFMVQSFSADLMLAALLRLEQRFAQEGGAQLLLTVHDSIVGEYYPEDWTDEELTRVAREEMLEGAKEELVKSLGVTERVRDLLLDVDVLCSMERWTK
jgi:DNA polymerase-1